MDESGQVAHPAQVAVIRKCRHTRMIRTLRVSDTSGTDEQQSGTTAGAGLIECGFVLAHRAVVISQQHAHRAHHDSIAQLQRADPSRREQVREGV
jgi:hypothetical protein